MLLAHSSTFLSPLFKPSSNFSIKSIDQIPKILCLVLLDFIKKSLLSSTFISLKNFFKISFLKNGVSTGNFVLSDSFADEAVWAINQI